MDNVPDWIPINEDNQLSGTAVYANFQLRVLLCLILSKPAGKLTNPTFSPKLNKAERGFGLLAQATKPSETAVVH